MLLVEEASSVRTHTSVRFGTVKYRQVWGYFRPLLQALQGVPFKWLIPHCIYQCYDFKREHESFRYSLLVIFFLKKKKNCVPYKRGHFSPGSDQELWLSGPIGVWLAITACWLAPWAVHLCVCIYVCVLSPDPNKSLPDYYLRKEKKCQCYQTCLVGNQLRVKRPYFLIKWV